MKGDLDELWPLLWLVPDSLGMMGGLLGCPVTRPRMGGYGGLGMQTI